MGVTADKCDIITSIVQRGQGDKVVKAALKAGAPGATIFYARGTGVRETLGILGAMLTPEKEVILIVTRKEQVDQVFNAIVSAGQLDEAGKGFAFVQDVKKAIGFVEKSS